MNEREQFEAWYAQDDQERSGDSVRMSAEFVASLRDGDDYIGGGHSALNKAWRAWQARAGVVRRSLLADLTEREYAFCLAVLLNPGGKLASSVALNEDGSAAWRRPEALGLVESVGSYKWVPRRIWLDVQTDAG